MVGQSSSAGAWTAIMEMFSSQSKARVVQLRTQLNGTRKENKTASVYFNQIKTLADEMAAAGKPLEDDDIVSYVLAGLQDEAYNGFVAAITALIKADKFISLSDLYSQLVSYEARLEDQNPTGESSVNAATRGGRGGGYRGGRGGGRNNYSDQRYEQRGYDQRCEQRGHEHRGGYDNRGGYDQRGGYNSRGGGRTQGSGQRPICQVCGKEGHIALNCWKRFQKNYHGPEKSVGAAVGQYGVDTNWYSDSGATDHITGELDKLHVRDRYHGNEQIHTASGAGMNIHHVGHSVIHTPVHDLHLKNILHVPQAKKNLLSTSRLAHDNHAFVEY
jgi:histone deacetylase 1/2